MSKGEQYPRIGSIETDSEEYEIIPGCEHTCALNGAVDSVTIHVDAKNAEYALLKFVYGSRVLFEDFKPRGQLDVEMKLAKPLLVGSGGLVAMYAKTEDPSKSVKVVGAFILREWDEYMRIWFPGTIW